MGLPFSHPPPYHEYNPFSSQRSHLLSFNDYTFFLKAFKCFLLYLKQIPYPERHEQPPLFWILPARLTSTHTPVTLTDLALAIASSFASQGLYSHCYLMVLFFFIHGTTAHHLSEIRFLGTLTLRWRHMCTKNIDSTWDQCL